MFNLEEAIIGWRRRLAVSDAISPEALCELESHLRDEWEQQKAAGLNDEEAFAAAVRQLGQADLLQFEFAKATATGGKKLLFRVGSCACAAILMLSAGWALFSFEPLSNRALGLAAISAMAFYILCLPASYWRLSRGGRFQSPIKLAGNLTSVSCLWAAFGAGFIPLPSSLALQMTIWSFCAAYAMTILAILVYGCRERSFPWDGQSEPTLAAWQSLGAAREQALVFNHDFVGTEHLLLGLLEGRNPAILRALKKWDISAERVQGEIERVVGTGALPALPQRTETAPYTPRALKALQLATQEAKALRHTRVGPEHIFLGLLREPDGVAGVVLRKSGVNTQLARDEILKEFRSP